MSTKPIKVNVCKAFFGNGTKGVDSTNTQTQCQPLGQLEGQNCAQKRIKSFILNYSDLTDIATRPIVSIENFIDLDTKEDKCLVIIQQGTNQATAISFGIPVDDWVIDILKITSNNHETAGQIYQKRQPELDSSNWMARLRGIDRSKQIGDAMMKAYFKFLNFPPIKFYPDYPKPGVIFKDLFPLVRRFEHREGLKKLIRFYYLHQRNLTNVKHIVGIDSKGFFLGPIIADALECNFVPIRKKGKLPGEVIRVSYDTEYSKDTIELMPDHFEDIKDNDIDDDINGDINGDIIICDDLLATGGTILASIQLVKEAFPRVKIVDLFFIEDVPELSELEQRRSLQPHTIFFPQLAK